MSVVQLWRLAPEIQPVADFHDGSCPRTVSRSSAQTGAAPGARALTGGAQQALNAAINLHHGGFESGRGVCVTGDMFLGMRCECLRVWALCVYVFVPAFNFIFHHTQNHFVTEDI